MDIADIGRECIQPTQVHQTLVSAAIDIATCVFATTCSHYFSDQLEVIGFSHNPGSLYFFAFSPISTRRRMAPWASRNVVLHIQKSIADQANPAYLAKCLDYTLFRPEVGISAGAAGWRDYRRIAGVGRGSRISGSTSAGGHSTPSDFASLSLSGSPAWPVVVPSGAIVPRAT